MAVSSGEVIRVIAKFVWAGQQIRNVYHIIHDGIASVSEEDLYAAIGTWLDDAYDPLVAGLTDELEFTTIEAINLMQDQILDDAAWPTQDFGGSSVSEACPLQIASVVRFPTVTIGAQGRKFIPGHTEGQIEPNGILSSGTMGGLGTYGASIVDGFAVSAQDFIPGAWNEDLARFAPFLSAIVNDVVGTQRRRKQGVGI